jgi:two-component system, chemotaxis family, chemotaxis protein CheY
MKNILIVEDDEPLCWLINKILSEKYRITTISSSVDAWCWLTEGNYPDAIISDISMPMMSGLELLENIKSSSLFKHIPVIILSGYTDPQKRKESLDLGAEVYIEKPFEPKQLLKDVNKIVQPSNQESYA